MFPAPFSSLFWARTQPTWENFWERRLGYSTKRRKNALRRRISWWRCSRAVYATMRSCPPVTAETCTATPSGCKRSAIYHPVTAFFFSASSSVVTLFLSYTFLFFPSPSSYDFLSSFSVGWSPQGRPQLERPFWPQDRPGTRLLVHGCQRLQGCVVVGPELTPESFVICTSSTDPITVSLLYCPLSALQALPGVKTRCLSTSSTRRSTFPARRWSLPASRRRETATVRVSTAVNARRAASNRHCFSVSRSSPGACNPLLRLCCRSLALPKLTSVPPPPPFCAVGACYLPLASCTPPTPPWLTCLSLYLSLSCRPTFSHVILIFSTDLIAYLKEATA